MCGSRYLNTFIERKVFRSDGELFFAILTDFIFHGLDYFFLIAGFAVYYFWPLGGVAGLKLILAWYRVLMVFLCAHAEAVKETWWVAEF